uniref:DC1 domain-containing protein n=1 Tax=Quercus lobata TaxID=97700 RepID=A0A7N2L4F8_QUELO
MEQPQPQQHLLHFSHSNHPLAFKQDARGEATCCGCQESVYGPTYYCKECSLGWFWWRPQYVHHKSCAELSLGLHHPLHPIHPLILFDGKTHYPEEEHKQKTKCQVCNESRGQYTYRCYRCDFNLHATCASLPPTIQSSQVHHHPLTPFWKWMSFTCDLCGKRVEGIPNQCALCSYCIHNTCASLPRTLQVLYHWHPLHLIHSSLEVELHQSDSRFCQLCAQKVNTNFGFYYCSRCDFVAHLGCAADYRNRDNKNLLELKEGENEDSELDQSVNSLAYEVKNIKLGEDGTKIATEIQHFSHEHELKLSDDEVLNNEKCNGCKPCAFSLNIPCSLISDILIHHGHEHQLLLSSIKSKHNCSCCDSKISPIFRCTTCDFALDFKCATLPQTARYKQHEHSFTLCYTAEDDSGEYYCHICEEERNPKHWFYYCENCDYPAHTKCILGEDPNLM